MGANTATRLRSTSYSWPAKGFHWLIALLILCTLPLGFYMVGLPLAPQKLRLFNYHKWIGITVLALTVLRLLWRLSARPPDPIASTPRWQHVLAAIAHATLYLFTIVMPITGWVMSSAYGFPTVLFTVIQLPDLVGKNKALGDLLRTVHDGLAWGLVVVLSIHIAAALWHQFVLRDNVLGRMLFNHGPLDPAIRYEPHQSHTDVTGLGNPRDDKGQRNSNRIDND